MAKPNPHAQALGRLGGRAKSLKKTKAARANAAVSAYLRKQRKKANKSGDVDSEALR